MRYRWRGLPVRKVSDYAENEDPQRGEKAISLVSNWQSDAPSIWDKPLEFPTEQKASPQLAGHNRPGNRRRAHDPTSIGQVQQLASFFINIRAKNPNIEVNIQLRGLAVLQQR